MTPISLYPNEVPALLRKRRANMSIRPAAKEIGISPTTLMKIESGELPNTTTMKRVCEWLGVSFDGLFFKPTSSKHPQTINKEKLTDQIIRASEEFNKNIISVGHQ